MALELPYLWAFLELEIWKLRKMVGAVGFEPTTSWSQTKRATKLRYAPNYRP